MDLEFEERNRSGSTLVATAYWTSIYNICRAEEYGRRRLTGLHSEVVDDTDFDEDLLDQCEEHIGTITSDSKNRR